MLAVGLPLVKFSRLAWAESFVSPSEQRVRLVNWKNVVMVDRRKREDEWIYVTRLGLRTNNSLMRD